MADNLRDIAVQLKRAGYPQELARGDSYIIDKTGEYVRFSGEEINDEFTRVPMLANLFTNTAKLSYVLTQTYLGEIDKENVCEYKVDFRGNMIVSSNIWAAMARLWLCAKV